MATPESSSSMETSPTSGSVASVSAELRVPIEQLPRVHESLARALGEAEVGGAEIQGIFATGVKASCVACGLSVTGAELGELALGEGQERERPLPPRLERLSLGYCHRNGCESRFFKLELTAPGRFDRAQVLARAGELLKGKPTSPRVLRTSLSPETRRFILRWVSLVLGTLFVAFVVYRLVFYRTQPIPFVQPKSPFTVDPASIDPRQR